MGKGAEKAHCRLYLFLSHATRTYHPVDEGDYEGEGEHEQNKEDQVAGDVEPL